ncbi:MAG: T9SS type A sorting domain-containing protein [Flavicella sp.]
MKKKELKLQLLIVFFVYGLNAQTCYTEYTRFNLEKAFGFSSALEEPNVGIWTNPSAYYYEESENIIVTIHDYQLEHYMHWPYHESMIFGIEASKESDSGYSFEYLMEAKFFSTSCYDIWPKCARAKDKSSFPLRFAVNYSYPHIFKRKLLNNLINYSKKNEMNFISIKDLNYYVSVYIRFVDEDGWENLIGARIPGLNEIDYNEFLKSFYIKEFCPADLIKYRHSSHNKGSKSLDVSVKRVRVYPNPSQTGQLTLGIASVTNGNMLFCIRDIQGNIYLKKKVHVEKGTHEIDVQLDSKLKTGIYVVEVNSNDLNSQQMIVIE